MSSSPISISPTNSVRSFVGRLEGAVAAAGGAAAVGTFSAISGFVRWVIRSDAWIFFFLVTKPLFDLTWRWSFFRFSEQNVNIQAFVGLAVLTLNGIAILNRGTQHRLPRRVLVFLGCATLSVVISPSSWGFNELLRLFAGTAFFYTAGRLLAEPGRFDRFAKVFLIAATVPIFLSFLQIAGLLPYDYWDWIETGAIGRVSGTYNMPLGLVFLFIYAFPLALYIANGSKQTRSARTCAWLFLICASIVLVFTYHRVGYLAIALEVSIWLYLNWGKKAVSVFVIALVLVMATRSDFISVLYEPVSQSLEDGSEYSGEHFLRGRGFQWLLYAESYFSSGPIHWVLGLGGSVIKGIDSDDDSYVLSPNEPHNDYIRILHAYGIVGLVLYLSILAQFFRRAIHHLRSPDGFARSLAQIMLPILAAVLLLSLTTEPMRYPTAVWYLFALGSALFTVEVRSGSPLKESLKQ
jgi:O-antigen ligase